MLWEFAAVQFAVLPHMPTLEISALLCVFKDTSSSTDAVSEHCSRLVFLLSTFFHGVAEHVIPPERFSLNRDLRLRLRPEPFVHSRCELPWAR